MGDPTGVWSQPEPDGVRIVRWGALLIVAFQSAFLVIGRPGLSRMAGVVLALHWMSIATGAIFFALTFCRWGETHWRAVTWASCAVVMLTTVAITLLTNDPEALLGSTIVMVVGAGAIAPWQARWQAALGGLAILSFAGFETMVSATNPYLGMDWLGLLVAVATGQAACMLAGRYRRMLEAQLAVLRSTEARLRAEAGERERAERNLRASLEVQSQIFDALPDPVVISNQSSGALVDFNQAFRDLGYDQQTLNRLRFEGQESFVYPEQRERYIAELTAKRVVRNMEVTLRSLHGAKVPYLLSGVRVELGGEPCVVSILRDITPIKEQANLLEQAHAELARQNEALRASEARLADRESELREIFNANRDIIVISDYSTGRYLECNDEMIRRSGLAREGIIGRQALELGFWANREQYDTFVNQLRATGEVRNMEADLDFAGKVIPCLLSGVAFELGGRRALLSIVRDISDIRAAQQRLRESEQTLRKIFDASPDAITINDMVTGAYIDENEEFVRRTGMAREDVAGKTSAAVGVWADPAQRHEFLRRVTRKGFVRDMEADFYNKLGEVRPCLISGVVIELNGGPCCLTITRDIGAIKETQRELVAAREAALAASRAKSEFLSSMSHEIRTPMNSILGMTELLAETALTAEQRRYVDSLVNNGELLLELINGILDLARVESGRLQLEEAPFDLEEVLAKTASTLAVRASEKQVELLVRIDPCTPLALRGDSLRLRQTLNNLIGNAIKFTERGAVMVAVRPAPNAHQPAALLFSVCDTGAGIAAEVLPNLFSAFTQADSSITRRYGGSGLGLAIARRLVELMRGRIWAASTPGVGSVFEFTAEFELQAEQRLRPASPDLTGKAVLLVGGSIAGQAIVAEMLNALRATTLAEADAEQAIAALSERERHANPFDLVIIDSAGRGHETANMLLNRGVPARCLLLMVHPRDLDMTIRRSAPLRACSWLVKPVTRRELFSAVKSALGDARSAVAPAASMAARSQLSAVAQRPLKVLLVDDSPDNRVLVRSYLRATAYQIDEAENGRIAVEKCQAGSYDLILMDIQMPEMDGYTAVRRIRELEHAGGFRRMPILALTASALEDDARLARTAGCDAHVAKPVTKARLLEVIFDAISSQTLPANHEEQRLKI